LEKLGTPSVLELVFEKVRRHVLDVNQFRT